VITGSIAYDYLMSFPGKIADQILPDKLEHISLSFLVDEMKKQQGGTAANIAYSLALMGEHPLLAGAVGQDFGPYRDFLEEAGVDTRGAVVFSDAFTASFFANTDQVGNQICSFYTGAMKHAEEVTLRSLGVSSEDLVIISPNDPDAMLMLAEECRELNIPFICDPGQQMARLNGENLKQFIQGSKLLVLNEYEHDLLLEKTGFNEDDIGALTDVRIVTLAEHGARIKTSKRTVEIPAATPDRILDPTGVGDGFRAGLMKGMINHFSWETTGRMGCLAATYVLETEGPQSHQYNLLQFADRYVRIYGESEELNTLL